MSGVQSSANSAIVQRSNNSGKHLFSLFPSNRDKLRGEHCEIVTYVGGLDRSDDKNII